MKYVAMVMALVACDSTNVDIDVDATATIAQGVYGQLVSSDDECDSDCKTPYVKTLVLMKEIDTEVARTKSDSDSGFYEIATEPGIYRICIEGQQCTKDLTIAESRPRVRCDFANAFAGGWRCN